MPSLQELQGPIDARIVEAVLAVAPESWTRIALKLETVADGGRANLAHELWNLADEKQSATPDDELYAATRELYQAYVQHGTPWKVALYVVTVDDDGGARFQARYSY